MPTLTTLITAVRRRANLEQSSWITDTEQTISDAEITDYINEGASELHEQLVLTNEHYAITTASRTITTGNTFALPSDCFKLRLVEKYQGDGYVTLREFDLSAINTYESPFYSFANVSPFNVRYSILGSNVQIIPSRQAAGDYRIWYSPTYTNLSSGSDTLTQPDNWTDYVVCYAALQCRIKQNIGSTDDLKEQCGRLKQRITAAAMRRGQPRQVKRIRNRGANRLGD